MKLNQKLITTSALIIALISCGVSGYLFSTRPKTAFVNLNKLYSEFEMKKQLETQLLTVQDIRKKTLDSLGLTLNQLSRNLESMNVKEDEMLYRKMAMEFDNRRQEFAYKQELFEKDNQTMTDQYNTQIWKQLNQYVKDYGDKNGYSYIMGGDGSGTMMYANQGADLTETLLAYTNERFKGDSK
jgi:outer membrane protein